MAISKEKPDILRIKAMKVIQLEAIISASLNQHLTFCNYYLLVMSQKPLRLSRRLISAMHTHKITFNEIASVFTVIEA